VKTILDIAAHMGATVTASRSAVTTYSDYSLMTYRGRTIEIRGSDHANMPNPTTTATVMQAYQLRSTARGFERAVALFLGFSAAQLRGLNLTTQRDCRKLAQMTPAA